MRKPLIILALISILIIIPIVYSQASSNNYNETSDVVDAGGGTSTSSGYNSSFSVGQPITGNSSSSSFNTILGFHQAFNTLPEPPTLIYPDDGAPAIIDRTPTFNWTVPNDQDSDSLHFRIQIANDSSFENITIDANSQSDTAGFSPTPPVACCTGNQYYTPQNNLDFRIYFWRVAAIDATGQGPYSQIFNFTISTSIGCTLSNSTIDFGSILSGVITNATLNYVGSGNGTKYNITSTSNLNVNITHKAENLSCQTGSCGTDEIPAQNITWQSNTTIANGTNMIYPNGISMQNDYDDINQVASNLQPDATVFVRYWLITDTTQGGGNYNGTYTVKCSSP